MAHIVTYHVAEPSHELPLNYTQCYSSMHGYMVPIYRVEVLKKTLHTHCKSITPLTLRKRQGCYPFSSAYFSTVWWGGWWGWGLKWSNVGGKENERKIRMKKPSMDENHSFTYIDVQKLNRKWIILCIFSTCYLEVPFHLDLLPKINIWSTMFTVC